MISVEEASKIVNERLFQPKIEKVGLDNVLGRICAQDISADRDFPPFNRVAMDGICIQFEDFKNGQRQFKIVGTQPAGAKALENQSGCAIEIMTGAMLATHADSVIRYEDVSIHNGIATVKIEDVRQGQNVHNQGSDRKKGDVLIFNNTKITATEIGVLATVGKEKAPVYKNPKIAIVSTGDELVDVYVTPLPYQIRKSKVHSLKALLNQHGIQPELVHLADDKSQIKNKIESLLTEKDAILMSGAVSKGKFDFLPEVLTSLGVVKHFHKVEQRPGKPFWFGSAQGTQVFAFPGNPVSTFVCAKRFFEPWLKKSLHQQSVQLHAILGEDVSFRPSLTFFLQVTVENVNGTLVAKPVKGNGSGDLANMTIANAFMEFPPDMQNFSSGEIHPIWMF